MKRWGSRIAHKTFWQTPDGYLDAETGQHYQLARYSDRATGTWLSQDSMTFGAGEWRDGNLHLYVGGSPLIQMDPNGQFGLTNMLVTAGVSGLVSAGFTAAYGKAKGWSTNQIVRAAGYSFLFGAAAGFIGAAALAGAGAAAVAAGTTASVGYAGLGIILGGVNLPLALNNYTYAKKYGDSTDQAFAGLDLGLAGAGFVMARFAASSVTYQGGTVSRQANASQTYWGYKPDVLSDSTVHRGSILYQASAEATPSKTGRWFFTAEALIGSDLDASVVRSRLQVQSQTYRYVHLYEVVSDTDAAIGVTRANRELGSGKAWQAFMPDAERVTRYVGTVELK